MKKTIANSLWGIILTFGLSIFPLAQSTTYLQIKSVINTAGSGLCLDVANGQATQFTPIVQFPCHNGDNQRFTIETFSSGYSLVRSKLNPNMCVGIPRSILDGSIRPGAPLTLVGCGGRWDATSWKIQSVLFPIAPIANIVTLNAGWSFPTGKETCLDVPSGSSASGLRLQIFDCNNGDNQKWRLVFN